MSNRFTGDVSPSKVSRLVGDTHKTPSNFAVGGGPAWPRFALFNQKLLQHCKLSVAERNRYTLTWCNCNKLKSVAVIKVL